MYLFFYESVRKKDFEVNRTIACFLAVILTNMNSSRKHCLNMDIKKYMILFKNKLLTPNFLTFTYREKDKYT